MAACPTCGAELKGEPPTCPQCGTKHHILEAEAGHYRLEGHPVGFTLEGDPEHPAGRRLESKPASGGAGSSQIDGEGAFHIELRSPLYAGRKAEGHVLKILIEKLQVDGADVKRVAGDRDDRGEDGILEINGERIPVQVTTIPVDVWERLSNGDEVVIRGDTDTAVSLMREAISRKANSAHGTLLALDASHIGIIVNSSLVDRYVEVHDDPCDEFEYSAVWVVGPTPRSTIRVSER